MMCLRKLISLIFISAVGILLSANACWSSNIKELLNSAQKGFYISKFLIEDKLNSRLPCFAYSNFLEFNKNQFSDFNVDYDRLNDMCSGFADISKKLGYIYYQNKSYDKAFEYAKKACLSDQAKGCELVASMIMDNQSYYASEYAFNEREPAAINFLQRGHKFNDMTSTAMLFDLYDQPFSPVGDTKKAINLIEILDARKELELAAEIRVKVECFKNRNLDLLKFVTQNCKPVCYWSANTLETKKVDAGSLRLLSQILSRESCQNIKAKFFYSDLNMAKNSSLPEGNYSKAQMVNSSNRRLVSVSDKYLCNIATDYSGNWSSHKNLRSHVIEAKRRGLSCGVKDNNKPTLASNQTKNPVNRPLATVSDSTVCYNATTTSNGTKVWNDRNDNFVGEANYRGLDCGVEDNSTAIISKSFVKKETISSQELEKAKSNRVIESNLPDCPKNQSESFHNCYGIIFIGKQQYIGEFQNNKLTGKGKHINGKNIYIGEFKEYKRHGLGKYTLWSGENYIGEFRDGKRHGQGIHTDSDGRVKEGIFKEGKFLYAKKYDELKYERIKTQKRLALLEKEKFSKQVTSTKELETFKLQAENERLKRKELERKLAALEKKQKEQQQTKPKTIVAKKPKSEFPLKPIPINFPSVSIKRDDIAVIIGNADYKKQGKDIPNVNPAYADAEGIKQYFMKAKGVREGNIIYLKDATNAQLLSVFGNDKSHKGKLFNYIKPNKSNVYIYYAGHGAPGKEGDAYLVPTDTDSQTIEFTGYPLSTLYSNLGKLPAKSMTVILEACFSGGSQSGSLISRASPIVIQPKKTFIPNNIKVIAAGSERQMASWEEDSSHSLFTKYFLKAMSGEGDSNKDGKVSDTELKEYLSDTMTYYARRYYGRDQKVQIHNGGS